MSSFYIPLSESLLLSFSLAPGRVGRRAVHAAALGGAEGRGRRHDAHDGAGRPPVPQV